ncbi:hypothetical protein [uncultured Winogradskyella sp.]|uniref:hypothetical protein n=1 Tax=uncultured Winogradskyella sp. TaxID=395353 RepID=UPI002627314E|nr:hypothetical protein [uncultured Winogradskyella sp.]
MKKLKFTFIMCLSIFMMSCSSDDDSNNTLSEDFLLGTWIGVDLEYSGTTEFEYLGIPITTQFVGDAYDIDYSISFMDDPNEFTTDGTYSIELSTTVLGETQVENIEGLMFLSDGNWSLSGNELTIVNQGVASVGTLTILSNDLLELNVVEMQTTVLDGIEYVVTVNSVSTFEREE